MSRRRSLDLAGALALTALALPSVQAQSTAPVGDHATALALGERPVRPGPAALKTSYRIHLRSAWPQLAGASKECFNGGEETLDGTLTANADGTYGGTFARRTRILFCGAHGSDGAESCQLTLQGEGQVNVSAVVMADDSSPSGRAARLVWVPTPDHRASVSGVCPTPFKEAVEAMYLNTHHSVELPLIEAGAAPMTRRLEDYAWTVEMN
jgi:hypothetical protein